MDVAIVDKIFVATRPRVIGFVISSLISNCWQLTFDLQLIPFMLLRPNNR